MDSTLLAGIIGGTCTIISPLVVEFLKRLNEKSPLLHVNKARRDSLRGRWIGLVSYEDGQKYNLNDHRIVFEVQPGRKIFKAQGTYTTEGGITSIKLKGGFYHDRFLKLEFENKASHIMHFGYVLFELSADSRTLQGKFTSYGRVSENIISGSTVMEKVFE